MFEMPVITEPRLICPSHRHTLFWLMTEVPASALVAFGTSSGAVPASITLSKEMSRRHLACEVLAVDSYNLETGTAADGTRYSTVSSTSYVENTKPKTFKPVEAFLPTRPVLGDEVICQGETTDNEESQLYYSYQWYEATTATGPFRVG